MNEQSLKVLEYPKILEKLEGYCVTEAGKATARELRPMTDAEEIDHALTCTDEAVRMALRAGRPPLTPITDMTDHIHRAQIGAALSMSDLLDVASTLRVVRDMVSYFDEDDSPAELPSIRGYFESLDPCSDLEQEISKKILGPNEMADNASRALLTIRREITAKNAQITDKLNRIIGSQGNEKILQDRIITVRNNRYVVPVKQEYRNVIPGIVLDKSSSGATLFIEPMSVVNLNNDLKILATEEEKEIAQILGDLTDKVAAYHAVLINDQELLNKLDFLFGKAAYALATGATRVKLAAEDDPHRVAFLRARHPLLDPKKAVSSDITIDRDIDTLVITGPNTGGKTVTLKTIGLLSLMVQSGLFVPVKEGSSTQIYRQIFADIGDEQSIEQSLSTFSAHMKNTVAFMADAQAGDLVLFDELGAGTDPTEGAALAIALLNTLHDRGVTTAATTHYSELKAYALMTPGVMNASVEFDVATLQPTYRLLIGMPGKSNAFEIAEKLGLSSDIIDAAKAQIEEGTAHFEDTLDAIDVKRKETERLLADAKRREEKAQELLDEATKKTDAIRAEQDKMMADAREKADALITETKDKTEAIYQEIRTIQEHTNSQIDNRTLEALRKEMHDQSEKVRKRTKKKRRSKKIRKHAADKVGVGSKVFVESFQREGEVVALEDGGKAAEVQIGPMKMKVKIADLSVIDHVADNKIKKPQRKIAASDRHQMNTTLDLRGRTGEEAAFMVEKFLSDAVASNTKKLTIVHGKGTGVLQRVVTKTLKNAPEVKDFRYGQPNEGGTGARIVTLK